MSGRNKQPPSTWDAYERGRASSFGSLESVPEHEQQYAVSPSGSPHTHNGFPQRHGSEDQGPELRRRSSIGRRFDSLRYRGGPNSIDNFAKSLQRAAGFREITPIRRGSITFGDQDQEVEAGRAERAEQSTTEPNRSLLRQQLHDYDVSQSDDPAVQDGTETPTPSEQSRLLPQPSHQSMKSISGPGYDHLRLPSVLGTSYGSISSRLTSTARERASILFREHEEASRRALEHPEEFKDEPPVTLERDVLPDGEVIERTIGESTVPMTVFNSTNVLIGVGILALPLGIRYAGWVLGLLFLTLAAISTSYTAKLLSKCLDTNTASTTYGDIAFLALGTWGRNFVEALFILELTAANVALVILFGDSMNSLFPVLEVNAWKAVISLGLIPLNFVPFKTLSFSSVIGIFCCFGIVTIVFADGLIKPGSPGSLRQPAQTYAFPENWKTVPLSLGLFMSPWGGHSVFPAVYKDMRHPHKYGKALKYTYTFTYGLDLTMAVLGYLMFGDKVQDEVTSNILRSTAYPQVLSAIVVVLIAIIPITKIPLSNRPMMDTINKKFYIDLRQMDPKARAHSEKSFKHRFARGIVGVIVNVFILGVSIGLPDFDSVMALMGSGLCFTICIILPIVFYLTIFSSEGSAVSIFERVLGWFLVILCIILAILGTVFAILPKETIGIPT
ncbi:transmembrane amino acid transporter protein-domain-containing protein [Exophiala viscosa]|uniref:transmembrane amino acid transporter protein-domain-containing protein n=1 Tax=Exophiala viscosa TaxID=2486360 RepID=UPI00219332E9|nr:transmembrane amino acid transporter protein-domain-containing protein [Exophiala viscosa]